MDSVQYVGFEVITAVTMKTLLSSVQYIRTIVIPSVTNCQGNM
jgi:hypothetical protein